MSLLFSMQGNQCFNSGNTEGSIKHYEAALAIQRAPPNDDESSGHIDFITAVLTNLALAHSKMVDGKYLLPYRTACSWTCSIGEIRYG